MYAMVVPLRDQANAKSCESGRSIKASTMMPTKVLLPVFLLDLLGYANAFLAPRAKFTPNSYSTRQHHLQLFAPKKEREPSIDLTEEQDKALRDAAKDLDVLFGPRWFDDAEAWDQARSQWVVLEEFSDEELRTACLRQGPRLIDVITETPLGPFVLLNLIAYFTGFSWCDTPWHADGACIGR